MSSRHDEVFGDCSVCGKRLKAIYKGCFLLQDDESVLDAIVFEDDAVKYIKKTQQKRLYSMIIL
jgi:hypothetical protein